MERPAHGEGNTEPIVWDTPDRRLTFQGCLIREERHGVLPRLIVDSLLNIGTHQF